MSITKLNLRVFSLKMELEGVFETVLSERFVNLSWWLKRAERLRTIPKGCVLVAATRSGQKNNDLPTYAGLDVCKSFYKERI